jgi:hypothetical protein
MKRDIRIGFGNTCNVLLLIQSRTR